VRQAAKEEQLNDSAVDVSCAGGGGDWFFRWQQTPVEISSMRFQTGIWWIEGMILQLANNAEVGAKAEPGKIMKDQSNLGARP
jgi:hypothetical protein